MAAEGGKAARGFGRQPPARVFISYRRDDAPGYAGRLADALTHRLGDRVEIFIDVDSITPGIDFADRIHDAVGQCDVLVELIGPRWSKIAKTDGTQRLADPDDFVRLELEAALGRGVPVIPALVQGAQLPSVDEIPESLTPIVRREAIALRDPGFHADVSRLVDAIELLTRRSKRARTIPLAVAGVIAAVALVGIAYLVLKPSGGGYPSAAEKSLLSHAPGARRADCRHDAAALKDDAGVRAAIRCTPAGSSEDSLRYEQYASTNALNDAFDRQATAVSAGAHGDCMVSVGVRHDYRTTDGGSGRALCYREAGRAFLWYTNPNTHTLGIAVRDDGSSEKLYTWWTNAVHRDQPTTTQLAALRAHVPADRRSSCFFTAEYFEAASPGGRAVGVDCPTGDNKPYDARYYQFASTEGLTAAYQAIMDAHHIPANALRSTDGKWHGSQCPGDLNYGNPELGRILCFEENGIAEIWWTTTSLKILARLSSDDVVSLMPNWSCSCAFPVA